MPGPLRPILPLAIALLAAAPPAVADDLDAALTGLSAPTAELRATAERELGRLLGTTAAAELVGRLDGLGPEATLRLASALGARDPLLGLAAELAVDPRAEVARIGRWALESAVDRWAPGLQPILVGDRTLTVRLADRAGERRSGRWRVPSALGLERAVELLTRADELPLAVVVDPALAGAPPSASGAREPIDGPWPAVLDGLERTRGVELGGLVQIDADGSDRILALLLTRDELAGTEPPAVQLARWVEDVARGRPERAGPAARALATCGWPAARAWLGARLVERGDPAARAGLMAAARRGWAVPELAVPEVHAGLVAEARRAVALGDPRAFEALEALVGAGPRRTDGSSSLPPLLAGTGTLGDGPLDPRWAGHAFEVAARLGSDHPDLRRAVASVLADPDAPATLVRVALEAWAAAVGSDPRAPAPARPARLLGAARDLDLARATLGALVAGGCPAPVPGPDLDGLGAALLAAWQLADDRLEPAVASLARSLASSGGDGRALEDAARLLDALGPTFALARAELTERVRAVVPAELADELAARGGWLPAPRHGAVLLAAQRAAGGGEVDPDLLAALATGPVGARAQELLVERLARMVEDPGLHDRRVVDALARAVAGLLAGERDLEADRLRGAAIAATRADPRAPASEIVRRRDWPAPPGAEPVSLADQALPLHLDLPGPPPPPTEPR